MNVLVTGGAGYIGSHVSHELADSGHSPTVLDDLSTGLRRLVPSSARLVVGDVGDEALVRRLAEEQRFDAVLHFAGSIVVPDSVRDPLGYYLNNTVKSRALLSAVVGSGIPIIVFSSTAAVYGAPRTTPVSEEADLAPLSPYGASKLMTERMLADVAAAHGLKYAALRYFNVAGADPEGRTGQWSRRATHLIKVACEVAIGKRSHLDIYGDDYPTRDGTCIRDYIHVTDLARAHLAALDHLRGGGNSLVLNCGYSRGYSVLDVVEAVRRVSGQLIPVRHCPRRAGDPAELVSDTGRLRQTLNWKAACDDLDTIVRHALEWEHKLGAAGM